MRRSTLYLLLALLWVLPASMLACQQGSQTDGEQGSTSETSEAAKIPVTTTSEEAKDLYRQVLLDLAERDRACFKRMVGGDAVDFEPITRDYYDTIINIQRDAAAGDS